MGHLGEARAMCRGLGASRYKQHSAKPANCLVKVALIARKQCCCVEEVPNVSVRPWARPLQAEFLKFGAKVHEGGDWQQPFEQVERVK